jgi:hypothetical protein
MAMWSGILAICSGNRVFGAALTAWKKEATRRTINIFLVEFRSVEH